MKLIKGGITKPVGYKANGMYCGIKRTEKLDLSLIYSEVPAVTAGVFTKNSVKAAPLLVCQKHLKQSKGVAQAIIVNSGNANCFTGRFGYIYADKTTQVLAGILGISKKLVLVSSTGIIGKPLPVDKIENAVPALVQGLSDKGSDKAAWGILTTDTKIKDMTVELKLGGKKVIVGAIAKGSGMTAPNMATMLAFVTTDAAISGTLLKDALKEAVNESFNSISIDGCMSTNDMVIIMANGLAKNKKIIKKDKDYHLFLSALKLVCLNLAKQIVLDAEGATKFIKIHINGAKTKDQARQIGLVVANSNLVKTAAFGSNPNWGRVAAAVGSMGIKNISEENLKIRFSPFDQKDISIFVDIDLGKENGVIYTSDLSYEYVKINGEYN